jgi:hypothetical protein
MISPLTCNDVYMLQESPLRLGYWCECTAHTSDHARVFRLGSHPAESPRLALGWLRARAQEVADQLDPSFTRPAKHWLRNQDEHQRATSALARGELYSFAIADGSIHYVLSARPTSAWPTADPVSSP